MPSDRRFHAWASQQRCCTCTPLSNCIARRCSTAAAFEALCLTGLHPAPCSHSSASCVTEGSCPAAFAGDRGLHQRHRQQQQLWRHLPGDLPRLQRQRRVSGSRRWARCRMGPFVVRAVQSRQMGGRRLLLPCRWKNNVHICTSGINSAAVWLLPDAGFPHTTASSVLVGYHRPCRPPSSAIRAQPWSYFCSSNSTTPTRAPTAGAATVAPTAAPSAAATDAPTAAPTAGAEYPRRSRRVI